MYAICVLLSRLASARVAPMMAQDKDGTMLIDAGR